MAKINRFERGRPKYPQIRIKLAGPVQPTGVPGSGFIAMVTTVQEAMREADVPQQDLSNFYEEAAEDDDLLQTCMRWVAVEVR